MIVCIGEPEFRGRGYATDALRLLLAFAWHDLNLHRVTARAFANNERATGTYRRACFREEGRMREDAATNVMGTINLVRAPAPSGG